MSQYDPQRIVQSIVQSGTESAMIYACCHNGNCYYPTRIGHQHANLHGRDIFGEVIELLNQNQIVPVAYYTVNFHNDSAKNHPEFCMRNIHGENHEGRYYFSCPNHDGYLRFTLEQVREIAAYPIAGLFIDMTFWPFVCYCPSCRKKYGKELPRTIDWLDPEWLAFQRFREESLADFGAAITREAKLVNPNLTVVHQFSPVLHGWYLGQTSRIAAISDYASGDFYGGKYQHRLGVKVFDAYTQTRPFEFMTSRCVNLYDHTSNKAPDEMLLHALTTLANGGAYFFIDAINPDGTLNDPFYHTLGDINRQLAPFKQLIAQNRPHLLAETGLYLSMTSGVNETLNGVKMSEMDEHGHNMSARNNPILDEFFGMSVALSKAHIPYRIVTDDLKELSQFTTIILTNSAYLSKTEVHNLREFVRNGGTLIATGKSSRYGVRGEDDGDFQLADVFGVSWTGKEFTDSVSYLACDKELIASSHSVSPLVRPGTATVLGRVVLPDFPVNDAEHFASIHSNPPGQVTDFAGLTINEFGRGRCIYLYSSLFKHLQHSQQSWGEELLKKHIPAYFQTQNLPPGTEITLLESEDKKRLILCIVNYQEEYPVIPLHNVEITFPLPHGQKIVSQKSLSSPAGVTMSQQGDTLTLHIKTINNAEFITLERQ